jgi:hypothetical protein
MDGGNRPDGRVFVGMDLALLPKYFDLMIPIYFRIYFNSFWLIYDYLDDLPLHVNTDSFEIYVRTALRFMKYICKFVSSLLYT